MTRFRGDPEDVPRISDPAWADVAVGFAEISDEIAQRHDLIVRIGEGAADGRAKACFIPSLAQIEMHPSLFDGIDPATLDPTRLSHRPRMPVGFGAAIHECGHARFTLWEIPEGKATKADVEAAMLLEESRMEKQVVTHRPGDRQWLRACVRCVVMAEIDQVEDPWGAATVAALVLARVDAGILDEDEVEPVRLHVSKLLDPEVLATLEQIWLEAQDVDDTDAETMMQLGRRWCEAVKTDPESDKGDGSSGERGAPGGEGDGYAEEPPAPGSLAEAVAEAMGEVVDAVVADIEAAERPDPAVVTRVAAREAETKEKEKATEQAKRVFGIDSHAGGSRTVRIGYRAPMAAERIAANLLAEELKKARYRDRPRVKTTSKMPPGRLRGRAAMAADAQQAMNQAVTAEPWHQTRRHRCEQPTLRVGIGVDISGSMGAAEAPLSTAAWVLGRAVTRAEGKTATVAYGNSVAPIVKPGEVPAQVTTFRADHGTESFSAAIRALDGALGLTGGDGVRLLVVVSDGHYTPAERTQGQMLISRLRRSGCGVLWLHFGTINRMQGPVYVPIGADMGAAVSIIGRATLEALKIA